MTENAYIHIPFCVKKCNYCSFTSFSQLQKKKAYIEALICDIKTNYKGEKLKTLYFGGGTPSLLTLEEIENIFSCFSLSNDSEITIEVNPNKLKFEYLCGLKKIGINRLSIGAQVFDADILKQIGRLHTPDDVVMAVENARKAGFSNISIDLIYGLPNQTVDSFLNSLKIAIKMDVDHISLYGLKIEEGTYFYNNLPANLPDDDIQADMYLLASNYLPNNNYEKYEISNFCKKGFESKHNLNYWKANTYYGFGCAAHGYESDVRYENEFDIDKYIDMPIKKFSKTPLSIEEKIEETIFLGFRCAQGINLLELKQKFNYDFYSENKSVVDKYIQSNHIVKTAQGYAFTNEGFLLSNIILSEFL